MRRTPTWILGDHLEDQLTDLSGDSPATADSSSHFAGHGPIQFESSLVPPNDSFWQDEKELSLPITRNRRARTRPSPSTTYVLMEENTSEK